MISRNDVIRALDRILEGACAEVLDYGLTPAELRDAFDRRLRTLDRLAAQRASAGNDDAAPPEGGGDAGQR